MGWREGHHGDGVIPLDILALFSPDHRRASARLPGEAEVQGAFRWLRSRVRPASLRDECRFDRLALVDADDDQVECDALGAVAGKDLCKALSGSGRAIIGEHTMIWTV